MVQKERQRQRSDDSTDLTDTIGSSSGSRTVSQGSMPKRLYSAVMKEGNAEDGAKAGLVISLSGLILAGITPALFAIPALLGMMGGGALLGKAASDKTFSVIGGATVASFLTFLLIGTPLGIIGTLFFTILATGGATAAYENFSD